MSKKKRIKKLVKGHLNRIEKNGDALYNDGVTTTVPYAPSQQVALDSLNSLLDGDGVSSGDNLLLDVLGIDNPGNPLTESINVDADNIAHKLDVKPFDAREGADTDGDGQSDNAQIVELFSAIESQQAALESLELLASAELSTAISATTSGATFQVGGGAENEANFFAEESKLDAAILKLDSLEAAASVRKAEIDADVALITALPVPETGITLDGEDPNSIHQTEAAAVQTTASTEVSTITSQGVAADDEKTTFDTYNDGF